MSNQLGVCMDGATLTVLGIIVASYIIGSFASSVDTELKLPHRY